MKPYISLKIRNHVPKIIFYPDEGMTRNMTLGEESILDNTVNCAVKLNFVSDDPSVDKEEVYMELLTLARESDEFYLEEYSNIDTETTEFNIKELFNSMIKQSEKIEEEYSEVEMDPKVRDEINKNQHGDIIASILESLYLRLIAKTVLAASELGIGEIHLDDEHKNARLAEKMSKELERLGLTLIIENKSE